MARLVIVSRRYWPLVGGQEILVSSLAKGLQQRGHDVTVVTAQWSAQWPTEIDDEQVRIVRLSQRSSSIWGTWSFMARLTRWMRRQRDQIDAMIVSRIGYSAHAAMRGLGRETRIPTIVSALTESAGNDLAWLSQNPLAPRIQSRIQRAAAIVANSDYGHQMLLNAGFPAERVHTVKIGVRLTTPISPAARDAARRDLRAANRDLALPVQGALAVTIRPLSSESGLATLIRTWKQIIERHPDVRLWIVGDGGQREQLAQLRRDLDLDWHVVLPGVFEHIDEVLTAANLYIADAGGHAGRLLDAMAIGLPVVAADTPLHREVLGLAGIGSTLYRDADSELVSAIERVFNQPNQSLDAGTFNRNTVQHDHTLEGMLDGYEDLITTHLHQKSAGVRE